MNLQFGIFITEKDLYSLHCRKIPDKDLLLTVKFAYQGSFILSTFMILAQL